jgi:hypothetical protein
MRPLKKQNGGSVNVFSWNRGTYRIVEPTIPSFVSVSTHNKDRPTCSCEAPVEQSNSALLQPVFAAIYYDLSFPSEIPGSLIAMSALHMVGLVRSSQAADTKPPCSGRRRRRCP